MDTIDSIAKADAYRRTSTRLFSATHEEILSGVTSDVYFARGVDALRELGLAGTPVVAEVFARETGVVCGIPEVVEILRNRVESLWGMPEGETFSPKEPILRIIGPYEGFGVFETAVLGVLASSSGWATAARRFREAVPGVPIVCFGARHVHPAVASVLDRAALVGGLDGVSSVLGGKVAGVMARGTIPHAAVLIAGDTLPVAGVIVKGVPAGERTVLVDTLHDEAEESVRVARAMGEALDGIRLDTPSERGGVTAELVREVKARLAQAGFPKVRVFVSGGVGPERAAELVAAGVDALGVGHHVSKAPPIDMTLDVKVVAGEDRAKRGRIPGITPSERLVSLL